MPREIKRLVKNFMVNPVEITVSVIAKPVEKINQKIIMLNNSQKLDALKEIVQSRAGARLLIFTKTKHGAEKVVQSLKKDGFMVASIHGNKSQNQRQKSLINFKNGSCPLLVATDIAARGIDVPGVEAVINYDLPEVPESYVHRIGRTARAGLTGDAISFCSELEIKNSKRLKKLINTRIIIKNYPIIASSKILETENTETAKTTDNRRKQGDNSGRRKFKRKSKKKYREKTPQQDK